MTMAERIKRQRKLHGINQEELSDRLGLSIQTIRRWEWGKRAPNTDIMPKLAEALGTSVAYLMGLEDEPAPSVAELQAQNVVRTAHESETVHTAGRLIIEWGEHNRIDWPDTPENRDALVKLIAMMNGGEQAVI